MARKKPGSAPLTNISASLVGTNSGDFSLVTLPATSVSNASSAFTTFVVQFKPAAAGGRAAFLRIASNDSDEGQRWDIQSGIPSAPQGTTFGSFTVSPANGTLTLGLKTADMTLSTQKACACSPPCRTGHISCLGQNPGISPFPWADI